MRGVSGSLNKITPIKRAVTGSNAPKIAVFVEPISFIPSVVVSIDIIVGIIANPTTHSHSGKLCIICNCVQNFKL